MKKKLLIGVFTLSLILSVVGVQAQTIETAEGTASADVTVWNVDTPVYNVDIEWDDLTFNWEYDKETGDYGWKRNYCIPVPDYIKSVFTEEQYSFYSKYIFTNSCSFDNSLFQQNISYEEASSKLDEYFYSTINEGLHPDYHTFSIIDNSVNTKITPSIEWRSSENYDWTIGKFYEVHDPKCLEITEEEFNSFISSDKAVYTDSSCLRFLDDRDVTWADDSYYYSTGISFEEITTDELPEYLRNEYNRYSVFFKLETDETKEIFTPTAGDKIGTITISIK